MKELIEIQNELKAPKGQFNGFGKYKYRSCEDILEAVKPLCSYKGCHLTLSDEIILIGDRFYIKSTATIENLEGINKSVSAFAREALTKKGMDESQITGSASSYARKYALNGLFCIDDTKDADTMDNSVQDKPKTLTKEHLDLLNRCIDALEKNGFPDRAKGLKTFVTAQTLDCDFTKLYNNACKILGEEIK